MVGAFHLDLQAVGKPFFLDGGDEQPASLFAPFAASRAHGTTSQAVRDFAPVVSYQPSGVVAIGGRRKVPSGIPRNLCPGREGARAHSRRAGSKRPVGLGWLARPPWLGCSTPVPKSGNGDDLPRLLRALVYPWRPIHSVPVWMARCLLCPLRCGILLPRRRGLDGGIERQVPAPLSRQAEAARGSSPGVAGACSSCRCAGSPT
jgi:hypothetical protein